MLLVFQHATGVAVAATTPLRDTQIDLGTLTPVSGLETGVSPTHGDYVRGLATTVGRDVHY